MISSLKSSVRARFGQPAFDVAARRRDVAREDIAEIPLAFDEVALVGQHHQRVHDGGVAVRMILHGRADDVGHLDETPVVLLVQRPEDAPLDRLEAVAQIRNGAVANDVGGVIQKTAIHAPVQRGFDLARHKKPCRFGRHLFRLDVVSGRCFARPALGLRWAIPVAAEYLCVSLPYNMSRPP